LVAQRAREHSKTFTGELEPKIEAVVFADSNRAKRLDFEVKNGFAQ
jgi:hypothetical protein